MSMVSRSLAFQYRYRAGLGFAQDVEGLCGERRELSENRGIKRRDVVGTLGGRRVREQCGPTLSKKWIVLA
jgi:hypothetical protein